MEKVIITFAQKVWKALKPWCLGLALLLVLRYTGALSAISYMTGSALMHTGIMDADTDEPAVARKFNYNFKISDLQGNVLHANAFKNKVIFLNVWATWCGPCRMEMPSIQSLYNQVDTSKVAFIMLSVDRHQDLEKVKSYVQEKGFTFPVYVPAGTLPNQLQVTSIPTTFVVSLDGRIATNESGASNYDTPEFKAFLQGLLVP